MHTIKTLTTPAGHDLVNVPAQLSVLLELGFSETGAQILLQQVRGDTERLRRNQRLAALDSVISNPLRWAEYTPEQQAALATYRQALLDVPQQAGFPENVIWPDAPGFLYPPPPGAVGQVPAEQVPPPGSEIPGV